MTVQEAKNKKYKLQSDILDLMKVFKEDTGLLVVDISVNTSVMSGNSKVIENHDIIIQDVRVKVEL